MNYYCAVLVLFLFIQLLSSFIYFFCCPLLYFVYVAALACILLIWLYFCFGLLPSLVLLVCLCLSFHWLLQLIFSPRLLISMFKVPFSVFCVFAYLILGLFDCSCLHFVYLPFYLLLSYLFCSQTWFMFSSIVVECKQGYLIYR